MKNGKKYQEKVNTDLPFEEAMKVIAGADRKEVDARMKKALPPKSKKPKKD